jgi:predicted GTPase
MRKLQPPQSKGGQELKKKQITKVGSQTPKIFLVCCSVAAVRV